MLKNNPQRISDLREIIAAFLKGRLDDKLDKLKGDVDSKKKRSELIEQFIPTNWIEDAARRVSQIQAVTHSLKPIHPDAKGTNLYCPPQSLPKLQIVGSHCIGEDFIGDVVGNAAALDVYKFLKLEYQGNSILKLALVDDIDLAVAFSSDLSQATMWTKEFAGLVNPRGQAASHTFSKQLYWLTGEHPNPHNNQSFHILSPLFASSLTQCVYLKIQEDRFSEGAKEARRAKKDEIFSERPVREYPQLAIQKLGGTKPQNISQLNSERRGENFLLASLPPVWRNVDIKPLLSIDSMFRRFGRNKEIKQTIKEFLAFLKSDPPANLETRNRRNTFLNELIDEFLQFSAQLRSLPHGWSQIPECHLSSAEKHWLDPVGVVEACSLSGFSIPTDTAEKISALFANWLNAQLRDPLPMDDVTFFEWRNQMHEQIKNEIREGLYVE